MFRVFELLMVVISLFTVNFATAQEKPVATPEEPDEYAKTVQQYYKLIATKKYQDAYKMLSQCQITLYSADSSGAGFGPRPDYETWLPKQKNIDSLVVLQVSRFQPGDSLAYTADTGDAEATLGIRIYCIEFYLKLIKEEPARRSGIQQLFVAVVKGTDDKIRILGIGTGP
ncbi:MAG: hypothetical protein OEZ20_04190 [candidate division WOR-3 bacterium]|nr:hypothetical protein [candidate division WOR-3 bacterium]MDH5683646.1 hypothetical protein [candidate division WOR-3 bacterium]